MKKAQPKLFPQNICCLCGLKQCKESTDHHFTPLSSLRHKIQNAKIPNAQIDSLKQHVSDFYRTLKNNLNSIIDKDQRMLQQYINKYYYFHLNQENFNIEQLCEYANQVYEKLPSKKAIKIVNVIQRKNFVQLCTDVNTEFTALDEEVRKYIEEISKTKQCEKLKEFLPYNHLILKNEPSVQSFKSLPVILNPQELQQCIATYSWKNIFFKSKLKTLELSNKSITDAQLLKQMPKLASFKNFQQLEIRNNKITPLSCKLIASNMGHVKSVDIRGNRVGDRGVLFIIKGMPHLKGLMISQTGCTNESLKAIIERMEGLQKLWCEHNPIGEKYVLDITNMPTLRVLSFLGCQFDSKLGEQVKRIFQPKGYVSV